ncbi:IS66 family transposase [Glaciimonas sp. GG7]
MLAVKRWSKSAKITEQLYVEPARFFVNRHIRSQYTCRMCETVTAAAIPAAIIDGGLAAAGLHAWVMVQKFVDHLPLYRIAQISHRYGVPITSSTLADWVGRNGVALQPFVDRLAERLRQRTILHADETPVQQLDPGKGKTKRAYLWAYRKQSGRRSAHRHLRLSNWKKWYACARLFTRLARPFDGR